MKDCLGRARSGASSGTGSAARKSKMASRTPRVWQGPGVSTSKSAGFTSRLSVSDDDRDLISHTCQTVTSSGGSQRHDKDKQSVELRELEAGAGIMVLSEIEIQHGD